jgi:hypothetical protein
MHITTPTVFPHTCSHLRPQHLITVTFSLPGGHMTLLQSVYPHCLGCCNTSCISCWWPNVKHYCEEYCRENISASDSRPSAFYTAQCTLFWQFCGMYASIFRVTEQVQSDWRISVEYTRGLERIWLITITSKREARPCPEHTRDKNSKNRPLQDLNQWQFWKQQDIWEAGSA